jgi:hypothetical protein
VAGSFKYNHELSGFKKGGEFFDQLGDYQRLEKILWLYGISQDIATSV